jgi:RHS repeat-associated protein
VIETRSGELDENGVPLPPSAFPLEQFVWSARYVDSPVLRDANTDADGLCNDETDQRLYYLTDANANVTALVEYDPGDTRWEVVERYSYSAYGNQTIYDATWANTRTESLYANTLGFTGQDSDPVTGLSYYRDRWYNPTSRTFINRDPEGFYDGSFACNAYPFSLPNDSVSLRPLPVLFSVLIPNERTDAGATAYPSTLAGLWHLTRPPKRQDDRLPGGADWDAEE